MICLYKINHKLGIDGIDTGVMQIHTGEMDSSQEVVEVVIENYDIIIAFYREGELLWQKLLLYNCL